jgi:hypothetical protein
MRQCIGFYTRDVPHSEAFIAPKHSEADNQRHGNAEEYANAVTRDITGIEASTRNEHLTVFKRNSDHFGDHNANRQTSDAKSNSRHNRHCGIGAEVQHGIAHVKLRQNSHWAAVPRKQLSGGNNSQQQHP